MVYLGKEGNMHRVWTISLCRRRFARQDHHIPHLSRLQTALKGSVEPLGRVRPKVEALDNLAYA